VSTGKRETGGPRLSSEFDRMVWVPVPLAFKGTPWKDPAEWAWQAALERLGRERGVVTKQMAKDEVTPRATQLLVARQTIAGRLPASSLYLHLPDSVCLPVYLGVAMRRSEGTLEEARARLGGFESENAKGSPLVEPFATDALGEGIRYSWTGENEQGEFDLANYVFRDQEQQVDLHVFVGPNWDRDRGEQIRRDVEAFVRVLRFLPPQAPRRRLFGR
jgi:hypothetical protein